VEGKKKKRGRDKTWKESSTEFRKQKKAILHRLWRRLDEALAYDIEKVGPNELITANGKARLNPQNSGRTRTQRGFRNSQFNQGSTWGQ